MIDLTHIEISLGQLVEHAHRLASAAERIADALEAANKYNCGIVPKRAQIEIAPRPPGATTPPYGSDTW